jgi:ubiquinone/menaquinone biosynthesis C-methylase UbiE
MSAPCRSPDLQALLAELRTHDPCVLRRIDDGRRFGGLLAAAGRRAGPGDRSLGALDRRAYAPVMRSESYSGLERFDDVDATGEEAMFVGFLERIEQLPDVVARRRRSYELLALRAGDLVADVGCGLGTAARELAALGVRVIGFDASEAMVAEARRRSGEEAVEFAIADVSALPLDDGALAAYRAERLYQHLADPSAALAEAWRVLAPGGRLVLVDQDWDAFLIDGDPKDVTRAILLGFADSIRNGWIGRSYHRLLTTAGFGDVAVLPETVTITSPEQGERLAKLAADAAVEAGVVDGTVAGRWLDDQRARLEAGTFFAAMTHFIAVGRRPS